MMDTAQILIVEDERIVARDLAQRLTHMGHTVVGMVASGMAAIQAAAELRPHVVLMDVGLPGELDRLAAAARIWAQLQIPVVYLTGYSDTQTLAQAGTPQPLLHLQKPFDDQALEDILIRALAIQRRDPPFDVPGR
jgi:DNA-binding NtrC family response regulator